jgi:hypothetical protein
MQRRHVAFVLLSAPRRKRTAPSADVPLAHLLNGGMTLCACASVIIIFATDPIIFSAKAPG